MSEYTNSVVAKYPDVSAAIRKALADALAAAEKAQGGTPPLESSLPKSGAQASETPAFTGARPDVELAEKAKARAKADGITFGDAMTITLSEDEDLAARYAGRFEMEEAITHPAIVAPPGMTLIQRRADVELAERAQVRAAADRCSLSAAQDLVLAEDPALKSRYMDFTTGRTALDELAYRAETIRAASRGRTTFTKATTTALAEDPTLRTGVDAYFERI